MAKSHPISVRERARQQPLIHVSSVVSLSVKLPVDQSTPPTMIHGPYVPLFTSTPVCMPSDNQQTTEATQDESSFRQVIPNISQQSLYPSLAAMGTSINTAISPSIPFPRRVINDIKQPFLSRSVRVPITEVGCLSFTQMLQDYLQAYPPPSQADAYSQIQGMAQWLDIILSKYPAQYIICMTSDSELVAFINYAIQLALDLTTYHNIWAVLLILLETQDVNKSNVQMMHDYYN